jgi:hypothetical protein
VVAYRQKEIDRSSATSCRRWIRTARQRSPRRRSSSRRSRAGLQRSAGGLTLGEASAILDAVRGAQGGRALLDRADAAAREVRLDLSKTTWQRARADRRSAAKGFARTRSSSCPSVVGEGKRMTATLTEADRRDRRQLAARRRRKAREEARERSRRQRRASAARGARRKRIADIVGRFHLDPFSNPRSHIVADAELHARARRRRASATDRRAATGSRRKGSSARPRRRASGSSPYSVVLDAFEHYAHTRWCALLRFDPRRDHLVPAHLPRTQLVVVLRKCEFEPPPGVPSSSNPTIHALYYANADDVTDAVLRLGARGGRAERSPDP